MKAIKGLIQSVNKIKIKISKERDKLRELVDECIGILETTDSAVIDLEKAVDSLSEYL